MIKLLLLLLLLLATPATAHELRPGYLELHETAAGAFDVLWKVPGLGENMRLGLYVELPRTCSIVTPARATMANNAFTERWTVQCREGLTGGAIHIAGLTATSTDVIARVERLGGTLQVARLTPSAPSFVVEGAPPAMQVVRTYMMLGIEHILSGIDHLLFVLALLIITRGGWKLVQTVTAFTISHSITLSLATVGVIHVPQEPVEAIIALSIVFVAAEIVQMRRGAMGMAARAPWVVAFVFGLMHGLGFAGGLSEAGLPHAHIPAALLFFSLGVEAGHFVFIGTVLLLIALLRRVRISAAPWLDLVPPYAIGAVASFWLIARIAAF